MNVAALSASPILSPKLHAQRVRVAQWAFGAAVRLSDQNRPLALKLCIECMILARALLMLLGARSAATARPARRAAHPRRARPLARPAMVRQPAKACKREVPRSARRRHARARPMAGKLPGCSPGWRQARVQQKSAFLCMVGLHG